ncbi:hypothetical protein [Bacillus piscicola]|uniref:hypothetical protein n=1 Tax=Bacillus piscicola TaxID=1632684 RepID=UPI001F098B42|nr:hypothetical protein [Bacillus piscicola]
MKNLLIVGVMLCGALFISGFFIPVKISAPPDVRTIVDHTNLTYVTPPCFNEAELSNYLQETKYEQAKKLGYEPESACTTNSLTEKDVPANIALLKKAGLIETKWEKDNKWK